MRKTIKALVASILVLVTLIGFQSFMSDPAKGKRHALVGKRHSIVGKWSGSAKGKTGTMVFSEDGYITMTINGETLGGKNFKTESGDVVNTLYTVNYKKKPHWIDVTVKNAAGEKLQSFKGIFEFVKQNSLRVRISFDGSDNRPTDFVSKAGDEVFSLDRVK